MPPKCVAWHHASMLLWCCIGGTAFALRGGSIGDVSNLGNDIAIGGSAAPCLYFDTFSVEGAIGKWERLQEAG